MPARDRDQAADAELVKRRARVLDDLVEAAGPAGRAGLRVLVERAYEAGEGHGAFELGAQMARGIAEVLAERDAQRTARANLQTLVDAQAADADLWVANVSSAREATLQYALRRLHVAIEAGPAEEPVREQPERAVVSAIAAHARSRAEAADDELRALLRWFRETDAADGHPDPALEQLLQVIESERPHRAIPDPRCPRCGAVDAGRVSGLCVTCRALARGDG